MLPSVTLVVPCYQEEAALRSFGRLLPDLPVDEVLFVDDGSTDGTAAALCALAAEDARARIATHPRNLGVGAAMRTGLAQARGQVVVVYDADRTYPPETISHLVGAVERGADIATASPLAPGGRVLGVPGHRLGLSRAATAAYRAVLGPWAGEIATFTCAFRAYRQVWARRIRFESDGFPAAAEILARALLDGARVVEVPAVLSPRQEGRSKMRFLPAATGHLRVLASLAGRRARPCQVTRG